MSLVCVATFLKLISEKDGTISVTMRLQAAHNVDFQSLLVWHYPDHQYKTA